MPRPASACSRSLQFCASLALAAALSSLSLAGGGISAGAARVDITPAPDAALPMSGFSDRSGGFEGIHDRLHIRTLVVDDGIRLAAIASIELISVPEAFWKRMTARLEQETGIPKENILLSAVHTHAAPGIDGFGPSAGGVADRRAEYTRMVETALVRSVREAKANLQPAKVGFGTGHAKVNMNRRAPDGFGGWILGNNPDGPSDRTVAVVRFETLQGVPFAILSNYAVHGTVLGLDNMQISGDLPGATARTIEEHYKNTVVSPWTSGAAGDQDPLYRVQTASVMPYRNMTALGRVLGQEVIRVAEGIKTSPHGRIRAAQRVIYCPGKRTVQTPSRTRDYRFEEADPVSIRLSLLIINDIAIAGVSGEVLTGIGLRLKKESPLSRTFLVANCNGSSGYIPDDAAYEQVSYEIVSSRLKPGHAEGAVVSTFVEMMREELK
jgi:neutral ceramidase